MPAEAEVKDELKVEVPDNAASATDGSVEIDIEQKPAGDGKSAQATPVQPQETAQDKAWKAIENQLAATRRVNEKLQKELAEIKTKIATPSPSAPVVATTNELDKLVADGRWQEAVGKVAEEKAQKLFEQKELLRIQQDQAAQSVQRLEQAKQSVIEKYPDLHPETGNAESPVSVAYAQTLNEHPEYLKNEFGPVLAMYEMEKKMNQPVTQRFQDAGANYETVRRGRANAASLPPSRPASGKNMVTIDRDEKAMIDYSGINAQTYAKVKKALAGGAEGIEANI